MAFGTFRLGPENTFEKGSVTGDAATRRAPHASATTPVNVIVLESRNIVRSGLPPRELGLVESMAILLASRVRRLMYLSAKMTQKLAERTRR
jgi:hypothetical protein